MSHREHRDHAPRSVAVGIITVSDTRTPETDESGQLIRRLCEAAGHSVVQQRWVRDDPGAVQGALRELAGMPGVQAVLMNGGTGISPRDRTCETVAAELDRRLDGFGELFRSLSYQQIGSAAMLSNAVAGLKGGRAVFTMPGSPAAVELAMQKLILPELGHVVAEANKTWRPMRDEG